MIHLFSGDDTKKRNLSYEKLYQHLSKNTETFFVNRNDFDRIQIEGLYSGETLFSSKCVVVFQNVFDMEETRGFISSKLALFQESQNIFIFLEGKMNKSELDAFAKVGAEVNVFDLPKEKKEKYNNFLVANAFGERDKLNTWAHFREAVDRGVGLEELVGVLFWKVKDMIIKKDFRKFSEAELKDFGSKLSYLLPEARKVGHDAESALEQFLLESL